MNGQEEDNDKDESEEEEVPETEFEASVVKEGNTSEDPFNIYPLLNKDVNKKIDEDNSAQFPPGFTPDAETNGDKADGDYPVKGNTDQVTNCNVDKNNVEDVEHIESSDNLSESRCSGKFKTSTRPRLTHKAKKDWVKELCTKNKVNFVGLQETKMEAINLFDVRACWGNANFDCVHSDSVGKSGGILCIWDTSSFSRSSVTVSDYFVIIRGVWLKSGMDLLIVVVYAPQEAKEKRMLWEYLVHVSNQWKGEIVMMGDFNEVRYKADRFGSNFNAREADIFNSFILNAGIEEIPLGGSMYTWCHRLAKKMSKLDRFFVSRNLIVECPNISVVTLERDVWHEAPCNNHNAIRCFMSKLKFLKARIRGWLAVHRLNVKGDVNTLKQELGKLDESIDKGCGSDEITCKRLETLNKIQQLNSIHASEVAQKAKINWAIEGDENVKFFHGLLNKKRSQNNIRGILSNGVWLEDPGMVKSEFFNHFRCRFDKPSMSRARINIPFPNSLSHDQKEDLESMVTKEEVKRAVWECGIDKSPGPDGFTFSFYRHFWSLIETDVFEAVMYFFSNGIMPVGCNSNFIALIPKIPDANMVKDFRPISLIGSFYKIITKILTNRLVNVIGDLVNEVQSAFVAGRQILDGPFILNEVLQWCQRKKKHALIFKVDFEKAYDSVRWDFLDDVLYSFGFGSKWRAWIQTCLNSSRGSILINGSPTEEFQFFKGLKQGDPLSPFLFILIMESLHISFQRVIDANLFTGIKLNSLVNLTHLFYADDALFIGQWSDSNIDTLVHVLDCFHRASSLHINMCKSKIMGVHVENGKVMNAAAKLGCMDDLDLQLRISSSSKHSTSQGSSPGTSAHPSYSPPSGSAPTKCSKCKVKDLKIKMLEARIKILMARLEMEKHSQNHAC
ncbi:RNA-directed DNA polymerase, eukaryota [Tanacetum coccineum]